MIFKDGWRGVLATLFMVVGATAISWSLFPLSLDLAGIGGPEDCAGGFANFSRPSYLE